MAGLKAVDYRQQLFALLPQGIVWATDLDSNLQRLLAGEAQEPARIDERAGALLIEADPRQASETFEEWEASYGLPSACAPAEQSMADRRAALIGRIIGLGGMTIQDYLDLAEGLGYVGAQVLEFREATVEVETATGHQGAVIGDDMNNADWDLTWRVLLPAGMVRESVINEAVIGDPLRSWGDELIECSLRHAAPSWLILQIGYLEE
ncbi:YmfQ family protein [Pseudomonas putida]|uniref:YmfQ family protein n=1 Tax=Pseudomonas putida TaxID=303 RepID=UPI002DBEE64F|nr:putative phage tail protein [Pseudomonas putida]WRW04669.1 putative phage tail protein [Pseudomonas putida]